MITTVHTDQRQILRDIMQLHNGGEPFQVDLTYGNGGFWRGTEDATPRIRMDLRSSSWEWESCRVDVNLRADVRDLPFRDGSIRSAVFDPPFIHAPGKTSIMGQRFSGYPSQHALRLMYRDATREIFWALAPGGLLVWKCQDIVESGKQVWNHVHAYELAREFLLECLDLFILTRKSAITGHNHANQKHARRTHCYFWVFRR